MPRRLLLVDDEEVILASFQKILTRSPKLTLDTASTMEEADQLMKNHHYHVVIAYVCLRENQSGRWLGRLRKYRDEKPEINLILMTGYGNPEVMEEAYTLGASYYLEKPVSVEVLKGALKNLGVDV